MKWGHRGFPWLFKRRLCQALYRRGSFDFASVAAYQQFIEQVIAKLNAKCQKSLHWSCRHYNLCPDIALLIMSAQCQSQLQ
ncbi:hypothetical protein [Acaryochloris sp. CCMEE 5410]|uniref:hypothetical protein n=1 Tax=Acaryochloris sp. CCMEE 5410 TaxID=310037 RepID=UPI0021D07B41|nr:hypothetical protein [Acaryochloris sp. CCMEE 5410]